MNLTLGQLISIRQTYEKTLNQKLLEMDVWFQNHMWDGSGDEDDPKYLSKEDFEAIEALTGKIKHMCLYIGCPNSVTPMIESIISRKIKYWSSHTLFYGDNPIRKGMQLKTKDCRDRVKKNTQYEYQKSGILKGHFRWNDRGYILSRQCTELLEQYYYSEFITD